jgi:hypothetical protein
LRILISRTAEAAATEIVAAFFLSADELFDRQTRITEWRRRLADDREIWKRISQSRRRFSLWLDNTAQIPMIAREDFPGDPVEFWA